MPKALIIPLPVKSDSILKKLPSLIFQIRFFFILKITIIYLFMPYISTIMCVKKCEIVFLKIFIYLV